MGRHTANGRHPMALQAELKARKAFQPAPAPPSSAPPSSAPPSSAPPSSAPAAPSTLTLKEKFDALPDEDLLQLAASNGLPATANREDLISALVTAGVTF